MIGAVINVGFYVGKNVGRVGTKDFNLGNGYILFIRSCFEITCKIRIDTLSKLPLHTQKKTFSIKDFFSKCDQIRSKMRIWSHLLKKFLIKNSFFVHC